MPKKAKKDNPYENLKAGAFTKQAKANNMSVDAFAKYVIKHHKNPNTKYNPTTTTFRRAQFYQNLVKKKK
tara:strand:+ start:51 stop:260 length:210 start_codon:yes stop_codon:yes gene_type:complete